MLNKQNNVEPKDYFSMTGSQVSSGMPNFKYHVQLGNNGAMVKSVLKQRLWWIKSKQASFQDCHFVWTQWKQNDLLQQLKKRERRASPNKTLDQEDEEKRRLASPTQ